MYIYDRDRHLKQDKVLGKVAVKRDDLNTYHNKDHWFLIRPVDADSEVQVISNFADIVLEAWELIVYCIRILVNFRRLLLH